MDRRISASVDATPAATMLALADLSSYPEWLSLVSQATADDTDIWQVTLRARLGPLSRSKRLRMRRTYRDNRRVRFERAEVDGRDHAPWILEATVDASTNRSSTDDEEDGPSGSDVVVHLHYGGALWSAPLEIVLAGFEGTAAQRLSDYLADG